MVIYIPLCSESQPRQDVISVWAGCILFANDTCNTYLHFCLQEEGTYHFRTTFLIPEPETDEVAQRLVKFHNSFLAKYGEPEQ